MNVIKKDPEALAKYQNYCKSAVNQKLNSSNSSSTTLEESESFLTAAFQREAQKLSKTQGISEQEATVVVIEKMLKNPKSLIDEEYLAKLGELIDTMELEQDK